MQIIILGTKPHLGPAALNEDFVSGPAALAGAWPLALAGAEPFPLKILN